MPRGSASDRFAGTFAKTPNPVGRVHPGVGHARKAKAPAGAWTNERHEPQKKFVRSGSSVPPIEAGVATMPVDIARYGSTQTGGGVFSASSHVANGP